MASVLDGFLGALLIYAALSKASNAAAFGLTLRSLGLARFQRELATTVIAVEFALGVALISGVVRPLPQLATGLVFASFALVTVHALRSGLVVPCMCFGSGSSRIGVRTFSVDLLLLVIAIVSATAPVDPPQRLPAVLTGIGLAAAIFLFEALSVLRRTSVEARGGG